jgi:hypothetical protein
MMHNDLLAIRKGMACLAENLTAVEAETFISALMRGAVNYTEWRQTYFDNAFKNGETGQLYTFLSSAAKNDLCEKSFGFE